MAIERTDPFRSFNFFVEIDGVAQAGFQECSGLDSQTASIDYREGNFGNHVNKVPGLNSFSPITLKRGMTSSDDLWNWRRSAVDGRVERRNVSIVLLDEKGSEQRRWDLTNAWASKWVGPAFNATGNSIAIETLEIMHEELLRR